MAKILYKQSVRKQLEWAAILLFIITLAGIALYPVNTPTKFGAFAGLAVGFTLLVLRNTRKNAKLATCPSCQTDLYEIIAAARFKKTAFLYCPACGGRLEV